MTTTTPNRAYRQGVLAGLPFVLVIVPFGALFGVVATEAGLPLAETMAFTVLVIAGASQFTAVTLMENAAPVWLVLAASLAVNLRMAMYSAALVPYMGDLAVWRRALVAYLMVDQAYAASVGRFASEPGMSQRACFAFYIGVATPVAPLWYLSTWAGAVGGAALADGLALDFALPITFLALVGPMLRTVAQVAAAATSVAVALALAWLPSGVGLLIAGAVAMAVGAEVERRWGTR